MASVTHVVGISSFDSSEENQTTRIYLLDNTCREIPYDMTTTVADAIEEIARILPLSAHSGFGLFECTRSPLAHNDEFFALDENSFIKDILHEFDSKDRKCKLLLKKKIFYESDEAITDTVFFNLLYHQFSHDFLKGNYPFAVDQMVDLANLSALQMFAEMESVDPTRRDWISCVKKYRPRYLYRDTNNEYKDRLNAEITKCVRLMKNITREKAKLMFMTKLRKLRYANSVFFSVKKLGDPIKLLTGDIIILGINIYGVHFYRHDPRECLHSAQMRDIKHFSSSSTNLIFNMRVEDATHEFEFETTQAGEICVALETHQRALMEEPTGTLASSAYSDANVCDLNQLIQAVPIDYSSNESGVIQSYRVKNVNAPILEAILKKHGDIAAACVFRDAVLRTSLLDAVCEIVGRVETNDAANIISHMEEIEKQLSAAAAAQINVSWLRASLNAIHKRSESGKKVSLLMEMKRNTSLAKRAARNDLVAAENQLAEAKRCVEVLDLVEKMVNTNFLESKAEMDLLAAHSII